MTFESKSELKFEWNTGERKSVPVRANSKGRVPVMTGFVKRTEDLQNSLMCGAGRMKNLLGEGRGEVGQKAGGLVSRLRSFSLSFSKEKPLYNFT